MMMLAVLETAMNQEANVGSVREVDAGFADAWTLGETIMSSPSVAIARVEDWMLLSNGHRCLSTARAPLALRRAQLTVRGRKERFGDP
jgi:hypothetical protein